MKLTLLIIVVFSLPFIVRDLIQLSRWLKRRRREREMREELSFRVFRVNDQLTSMRQALGRAYAANAVLTARISDTEKDRRLRDEAGRRLSNAGQGLSQASMRLSAASRATEHGPRELSEVSYQHCSERFDSALANLSTAQSLLNDSLRRERDAWKQSNQACLAAVLAADLALSELEALELEVAGKREAAESGDFPTLAKDWEYAIQFTAASGHEIRHYTWRPLTSVVPGGAR